MKKIAIIILMLFIGLYSCQQNEKVNKEKAPSYVQVEMQVEGMTCTGCEKTIEANVNKLEGIGKIKADHEAGTVLLSYDEENVKLEEVKKVMADKGYTVVDSKKIKSGSKE